MQNHRRPEGRLIVVSNRLPFTLAHDEQGYSFVESAGGLVTGLTSYLHSLGTVPEGSERRYVWVGWPGGTADEAARDELTERCMRSYSALPVFLPDADMKEFYHGFCNKTIWPLFHYFPSIAVYQDSFWETYVRINAVFADAVAAVARPTDTIWVHDYHLMLLPSLLRQRLPEISVGFFLHIPFPSFEIFRLLPVTWRKEILEGLLAADLVGFHTYEYTQHFLQSVLRILGHEHQMGQIVTPDHVLRAATYPMGIDYERFAGALEDDAVAQQRLSIREPLAGRRVILSIDRLDYSKGILKRLEAFELLLSLYPRFLKNIVLVIVVVPSRIGVEHYERMKRDIEETVGRINGRFGGLEWTPVLYQYRQLDFTNLTALYGEADVAMVTPLRDGMNLIAKEYIATRAPGTGVLILSEMAGAAKELGEAIIVNPNDRSQIAEAMRDALDMSAEEQVRRNRIMQTRLQRYTVHRWAADFTSDLAAMREVQSRLYAKVLPRASRSELIQQFAAARRRLLLLDYDGTLTPLARRPSLAHPSSALLDLLGRVMQGNATTLVLISGRDREWMDRWFGSMAAGLVAEHGMWSRDPGGEWARNAEPDDAWKAMLLPIMELYADRLPGAFVEQKSHSLVWHYRTADPEQARVVEAELADHLVMFTANINVHVLRGSKVLEVRHAGVTKGTAARGWQNRHDADFILAAGDDVTDEDTFQALPESAWTIRIGVTNTKARFNLRDHRELLDLLENMVRARTTMQWLGIAPGEPSGLM